MSHQLEGQPCLHDYARMKFKVETSMKPINCPQVTWKDSKKQWVVLCGHIAPHHCYLTYCAQEDIWLASKNRSTLPRIRLDNFLLYTRQMKIDIVFGYFTVVMEFDSQTKLKQWLDAFATIRSRIYVELIRCPERPELEKEYVLHLSADRIIFYSAKSKDMKGTLEFQWPISVIKRAKYHNFVGKVEIEVGRSAETGNGQYYFIGFGIKRLFKDIKKKIEEAKKSTASRDSGSSQSTSRREEQHTISAPIITPPGPPPVPGRSKSATMSAVGERRISDTTQTTMSIMEERGRANTVQQPGTLPPRPLPRSNTLGRSPMPVSAYENEEPPPLPPRMEIDAFGEVDLVAYHTVGDDIMDNEISYDVVGEIDPTPPPLVPLLTRQGRHASETSIEPPAPPIPPRTTLPRSQSLTSTPPAPPPESIILSQQPWRLPMDDPRYQPLLVFQSRMQNDGSNGLPEESYDLAPRPPLPPPHPPPYPPPYSPPYPPPYPPPY